MERTGPWNFQVPESQICYSPTCISHLYWSKLQDDSRRKIFLLPTYEKNKNIWTFKFSSSPQHEVNLLLYFYCTHFFQKVPTVLGLVVKPS